MHFRATVAQTIFMALHAFRPGSYDEEVKLTVTGIPNATIKSTPYNDEEYEDSDDGGYTGTFKCFEKNESDLTVIWVTPEERLLNVVDYWTVNVQSRFHIIQRFHSDAGSEDLLKMFQLQNPHRNWTLICAGWIAMMVALKLTSTNFATVHKRHPAKSTSTVSNEQEESRNRAGTSLFYQFGLVLYQNVPFRVGRISTRIVSFCYQIFVMIFVCAVYANTKTSLMVMNNNFIKDFAELAEQPPRLGAWISGTEHAIEEFMNSDRDDIRHLMKRVGKNILMDQTFKDIKESMMNVTEGRSVGILEFTSYGLMMEVAQTVVPKDTVFFSAVVEMPSIYAVITRKTLEPEKKAVLRRRFGMMRDAGFSYFIAYKLYAPILPQGRVIENLDEAYVESVRPLDVSSLQTTFILWAIGLIVSVVCFIIEKILGIIDGNKDGQI